MAKKLNSEELCELFNEHGVTPVVNKGKVTLEWTDETFDDSVFDNYEGWVEEHPEGSDRGGYRPYVEVNGEGLAYNENGDGWEPN